MNVLELYSKQICPVCGYKLNFIPWEGEHFQERPCPSCGIFFGFDDRNEAKREQTYLLFRQRWIEAGKRWWSKPPEPPANTAATPATKTETTPSPAPTPAGSDVAVADTFSLRNASDRLSGTPNVSFS